jgi:hypothetical protein
MKNLIFWIMAFFITVSAAVYQRSTGPTYPAKKKIYLEGEEYRFKLTRSHTITKDFFVSLKDADEKLEGSVFYRRYPTNDEWQEVLFVRVDNDLKAQLPIQPPAGKLEYYLLLKFGEQQFNVADEEPVIIRFKDDVPPYFMIPHILAMFLAMMFSSYTGILAIIKDSRFRKYAQWTFGLLFLGGMILGPIIQKYAFGDFWTGWPFGKDLTDNKTLIAVIFWGIAVVLNLKKERKWIVILAAIILLAVYSIPHSTRGSELDYETGKVVTG